jgi:hypothetical protein
VSRDFSYASARCQPRASNESRVGASTVSSASSRGCEVSRGRSKTRRKLTCLVEHDRGPGRPPVEFLEGDGAVRLAQVLAVREMMGVGSQELQRLRVVLRDASLLEDGIGLYVDADRTGHVLLTQARGAAHVAL